MQVGWRWWHPITLSGCFYIYIRARPRKNDVRIIYKDNNVGTGQLYIRRVIRQQRSVYTRAALRDVISFLVNAHTVVSEKLAAARRKRIVNKTLLHRDRHHGVKYGRKVKEKNRISSVNISLIRPSPRSRPLSRPKCIPAGDAESRINDAMILVTKKKNSSRQAIIAQYL